MRDRLLGWTTLVSVSSSGEKGDAASYEPSISADGRHIAFNSVARNLVENDTNHAGFAPFLRGSDIFVHTFPVLR